MKEEKGFWNYVATAIVVLFGLYLVLATANCAVREAKAIYETVVS